ncbi:MAG: Ig-like domain-containing protein [Candidatus Saccharibacteria bacterium]
MTTNEPADSQIEYGRTASYGSTTTKDATLTTDHSVTISGLTKSTIYHFRVRSADAAGNVGFTADSSFTTISKGGSGVTGDTTPPTVTLDAPVSGANVSGTLSVSVTAVDATGVKQVDFYIDGNPVATVTDPT